MEIELVTSEMPDAHSDQRATDAFARHIFYQLQESGENPNLQACKIRNVRRCTLK